MPHRFSGGGRELAVRWTLRIIFCCILLLSPTPPVQAQPSSPALDAILARIEFNGTETPETLGPDLVKLTERDLGLLCDMLVEPGSGDDTKARMALHALALYVASEGTPAQRHRGVDALCKALDGDAPASVKAFLIRQLELTGDERAVETLFRCLLQDELRDPAAQTLLTIGGEAAVKALLRAAEGGTAESRVTILTTIRQSGDADALGRLAAEMSLFDLSEIDQVPIVDLLALTAAADLPSAAQTLREVMRRHSGDEQHSAEDWRAQTQ
ncbi:MAG: hypothetical protein KKI02_11020, partial [Planctomycetes bacterium]|nr:hypothetical protein [Planctomycetota bacterium]